MSLFFLTFDTSFFQPDKYSLKNTQQLLFFSWYTYHKMWDKKMSCLKICFYEVERQFIASELESYMYWLT